MGQPVPDEVRRREDPLLHDRGSVGDGMPCYEFANLGRRDHANHANELCGNETGPRSRMCLVGLGCEDLNDRVLPVLVETATQCRDRGAFAYSAMKPLEGVGRLLLDVLQQPFRHRHEGALFAITRSESIHEPLVSFVKFAEEQIFLGAKMLKQSLNRNACTRRDLRHRDVVIATVCEHLRRGLQQFFPGQALSLLTDPDNSVVRRISHGPSLATNRRRSGRSGRSGPATSRLRRGLVGSLPRQDPGHS